AITREPVVSLPDNRDRIIRTGHGVDVGNRLLDERLDQAVGNTAGRVVPVVHRSENVERVTEWSDDWVLLADPGAGGIDDAHDQLARSDFVAQNLSKGLYVRRIHVLFDVGRDAVKAVAARRAVGRKLRTKVHVARQVVQRRHNPANDRNAVRVGNRQQPIEL